MQTLRLNLLPHILSHEVASIAKRVAILFHPLFISCLILQLLSAHLFLFPQLTVGEIVDGGAAAKEGSLQTGDQLLSIDNTQVNALKHNQVRIAKVYM